VDLLRELANSDSDIHIVAVEQGLGVVPMSQELSDRWMTPQAGQLGFDGPPAGLAAAVAAWSAAGPIAYVEAEFWAGDGEQNATVWNLGEIVLGPLSSAEGVPFPTAGSPISQALRRLGAVTNGNFDEFDAVHAEQLSKPVDERS